MAITISWSESNGGLVIDEPLDHSNGGNGATLLAKTIFLSHDGANAITNCLFFLEEKLGDYSGGASPSADLAEILGWGDAIAQDDFGGYQLNLNAVGVFPSEDFPVYNDKQRNNAVTFLTGVGDTAENGVILPVEMGLSTVGEIPIGTAPNVRFQSRIQIPTNELVAGIREFEQRLRFTFTS